MSNFKYQISNNAKRYQRGFTLVEMLTVVAIFVVIGSIGVAILTTSFRTSSKTNIVTLVQQNGNYALSQIVKTVRDARGIVAPFPCSPPVVSQAITITTPDNQAITYACLNGGIASNSAQLLDTTQVKLTSCSFTCSQQSLSDLPIITIDFFMKQQSASTFAEQTASASAVEFQTSVVMRNINR